MSSTINASNSGFGGIVSTGDSSGQLQLQTAGTTAVTIDTSQNVGIGTTSPATKLQVTTASGTSSSIRINQTSNGDWQIYNPASSTDLRFYDGTTDRVIFQTGGNLQFNSGYGSVATAYGCRAWVNFNGTGTVAIRGSGNVTSITDNGTGDYTVNFTSAMPDANYAPVIATQRNGINSAVWGSVKYDSTMATSNVRIATVDVSPTAQDPVGVFVSIFR